LSGTHKTISNKFYLHDGFEVQYEKIQNQVRRTGHVTKKQLEFLFLYNVLNKNKEGYEDMKRDMRGLKIMPSVRSADFEGEPVTARDMNNSNPDFEKETGPTDFDLFQRKFEEYFNI